MKNDNITKSIRFKSLLNSLIEKSYQDDKIGTIEVYNKLIDTYQEELNK